MAIYVFGSINIDNVYKVPHFPAPGETLSASAYSIGLGGKGANQAIAAASAGAEVEFVGAIGENGAWARNTIEARGVGVTNIQTVKDATGHAIINVDAVGENQIVIYGGANVSFTLERIKSVIASCAAEDIWLVQNETNLTVESMAQAKAKGLRTAYAAAPFDAKLASEVLPFTDILFVNEGENDALIAHLGNSFTVPMKVTTLGARGAKIETAQEYPIEVPAFNVEPVDTTGAGDTFTGVFLAELSKGNAPREAGIFASAAAALCVTRMGAADAIPSRDEINTFLKEQA